MDVYRDNARDYVKGLRKGQRVGQSKGLRIGRSKGRLSLGLLSWTGRMDQFNVGLSKKIHNNKTED